VRELVSGEFSITTRTSADESMAALGIDILDVINALRTCHKVTMTYAKWPCIDYHGWTLDGDAIVVVSVVYAQEKVVKIVKVWKG